MSAPRPSSATKPNTRVARRIAAHRRAVDMAAMIDEAGLTSAETAARLGISKSRVIDLAHRFAVPLQRPGQRRLGVWLSTDTVMVIRKISESVGVSPAELARTMIEMVADGGEAACRRRMGKHARPKRRDKGTTSE